MNKTDKMIRNDEADMSQRPDVTSAYIFLSKQEFDLIQQEQM